MLKRKFPCSPFKRRDCMETIKILTPTIGTDYQYILIQFIYSSALRLKQLPISSPHATIRLPLFRIALNICKKFIPYIKSYFLMRGISLLYYGKGTY